MNGKYLLMLIVDLIYNIAQIFNPTILQSILSPLSNKFQILAINIHFVILPIAHTDILADI